MNDRVAERFARLEAEPFATTTRSVGLSGGWSSLAAVLGQRQLLGLLIRRDIKARYKDSVLGLLWTLINPLVQLAVYYLVIGQILGAERGIPNFAVYVFSGLTIYGLFNETLQATTGSIVSNSGLVKKVYVPREVFPLAATGAALFTFGVQLLVLIAAAALLGSLVLGTGLLYFLPAILIVVIYAGAFGLVFSGLNVYLRDVQYLSAILLTLALWAAPVIYSWTMVRDLIVDGNLPPWLLEVYTDNPLTLAVLGFHKTFWAPGTAADYPPDLGLRMAVAIGVGLVLLWVAQRIFARLQGDFAQEL